MVYAKMHTIASILESSRSKSMKIGKSMVPPIRKISFGVSKLLKETLPTKNAVPPIINPIKTIVAPIMFPKESCVLPSKAEFMPTKSSGVEVAIPSITKATTNLFHDKDEEIRIRFLITMSALFPKIKSAARRIIALDNISTN